MAKPSPAKTKMLASQAKKTAASNRELKKANLEATSVKAPLEDDYFEHEENWREIGLRAPIRRVLVNEGFYQLSDLRKISLLAVKELPGMEPNAIRILVSEMKKQDLSFRS